MYRNPDYKFIDFKIFLAYIGLMFLGLYSIYVVEYDSKTTFSFYSEFGKQILFHLISLTIGVIILLLDGKFLMKLSYLIYIFSIILLICVLLFGETKHGAKSWFDFGVFGFQPAELAKFGTVLAISTYLSKHDTSLSKKNNLVKVLLLIAAPVFLIFLQPDMGSCLVFGFLIIPLFREGLNKWIPIFLLALLSLFIMTIVLSFKYIFWISLLTGIAFLILKKISFKKVISILILSSFFSFCFQYTFNNLLKPHQQTRINVLIGKNVTKAERYNLDQSLIGIGSGGLFGKGFLQGTQTKGDYIPEQSTDFIFCTIGEEFGFLGSFITIMLFVFIMIRIIIISERQRSKFSRVFGYSFLGVFFSHFSINIGMILGLFPVVGIPLPFVSYGGTALITMTIFLFFFLKLDSYRMEILK
tara:strand:- start:2932 stop:4173 length:1242 start_codon:yes stop_codon:yes gene_type:complete